MSDESYFLVSCSEDGDVSVSEIKDIDGYLRECIEDGIDLSARFFESMPEETDLMYWGGKRLLIKGRVVCVRPMTVTTKWKVE